MATNEDRFAFRPGLLLAVLALAVALASVVIAGPRLTMPETEFNFGIVPQYSKISHLFRLYSTGTDTLKVLQINPG